MVWKNIEGYEGHYQISNCGQVKSLKWNKERLLKPSTNGSGYYYVNISKNNRVKNFSIHTLLWDHFGDSKRDGRKLQVDHKDENKLNNHIDNLQLLKPRSNVSKSVDKSKTTSKYIGARWHKGGNKWVSQIRINNKYTHLGYFNTEYEAHLSYQQALKNITNQED